jgi:hypothetical protein
MCLLVFALARGITALMTLLAERRRRKPPPDVHDDGLTLAA